VDVGMHFIFIYKWRIYMYLVLCSVFMYV